jgi:CRP-like cAMP-binding protein
MSHASSAFLTSLAADDQSALGQILIEVSMAQSEVLYEPHQLMTSVYFPFDAVVSLVIVLSSGDTVETAMIGHDGVVGAGGALDGRVSADRAIVQIGGRGLKCSIEKLRSIMSQSLQLALFRHQQTVLANAQQSAACNITHPVEGRLARWLLRAHDLTGEKNLPLTQQFLAEMLGVQRSSVSIVAHTLQQAGLIRYRRGHVELVDIEALRECACECYDAVRMSYEALVRPHND